MNGDLIWVQPTKYGKCERDDRDRWNKWDGLWTEGNKMKHVQWSVDWRKWQET